MRTNCTVCWLVAVLLCAASTGAQPNFVIIMADDLGYNDLGVTGNPDVQTPNINSLAWESVRFEKAFANPVCAPTRAQLLTGRHYLRTGVWGVHGARDYMNLDEVTFAQRLRWAGYRTAMFGKWHNGVTDGYVPWHRGFDEACTVDLYDYYDNHAVCNGQDRFQRGWTTDRIFDWSIDFMQRKKDEKFLLYIPLMTPHLGKTWYSQGEAWHAPEEVISRYQSKGLSYHLARLYASIDFMDYNVGRLLNHMNTLGLSEKTVVIFLSDNGPTGNYLMSHDEWWRRNPSGLNGLKGEVKDNGIRVPLFIRWRGKFQSAAVKDAIVSVEDLFPTLMDLSGAGWGDRYLDGKSLTPLLWNPYEAGEEWVWRSLFHVGGPPQWTKKDGVYHILPNWGTDKSSITWGKGGKIALRHGRYKYSNIEGMQRLYDVWNDPSERNPIWDWNRINSMDGWAGQLWDSMVWEHGSFSVPVFYLGWTWKSTIMAMGAAETSSNLKIRSHHVEGWAGSGTYAYYKVNILRSGCYRASIVHWGGFHGKVALKSSCNGEAYSSGHISWGGEFASLCIPEGGSSGCFLQFSVEYGEGWLGFSQLILQNS